MKRVIAILVLLCTCFYWLSAQNADYLVLKKKNGRILKTYYAGGFISAQTYDGFRINGFIRSIHNDSVQVLQEETQLMPTALGVKLDTVRYPFGIYYNQIKFFYYGSAYSNGKKRGFSQISLPKLLWICGLGFIAVELVNTAYRSEPIDQNNKLSALGIAGASALGGYLWSHISHKRNRAGGKYQVIYVRAHSLGQ
jgi:hypothetical protein